MNPSHFFSTRKHQLIRVGLLIGFWVLFTLLLVSLTYVSLRMRDIPVPTRVLVGNAFGGLVWIPFSPVVVMLARRFPIVSVRWGRHLVLHLLSAVVLNTSAIAVILPVSLHFAQETADVPFLKHFALTAVSSFLFFALIYAALVTGVYAYDYAQRVREGNLRAAQLESQLAHAQLEALRMQLNPHFLFNTLHAVSALMSRNVGAARSMLAELSDLLRLSLDRVGENEIPLEDELAFLRHYLKIEQIRFRDRLTVDEHISAETCSALVPTLLLQPLVENAIKHGVAPRGQGGQIIISAHRDSDLLVLTIADDGEGLRADGPNMEGIGVRNTRARLSKLYGDLGVLMLCNRPQCGLIAEVRLPFHSTPYPAPQWLPLSA